MTTVVLVLQVLTLAGVIANFFLTLAVARSIGGEARALAAAADPAGDVPYTAPLIQGGHQPRPGPRPAPPHGGSSGVSPAAWRGPGGRRR